MTAALPMDVSTVAALYGIFSRQIRHGAGHKDNGVHNRINWGVIKYVAAYRRKMRPRLIFFYEYPPSLALTARVPRLLR
ncbi:hypothetical protein [Actinoplanes sp. NPDC049118]|uniref:hypothetical protein n=1 Tax=Actinoplanes sp. NPDC049118 TaxID=3155769 RepID=UPI0033F39553